MKWVTKLMNLYCNRFNGYLDSSSDIHINNYVIKIINDDNLFSIKVIDFNKFTPSKQVNNIFCDELESNLEKTLKDIA